MQQTEQKRRQAEKDALIRNAFVKAMCVDFRVLCKKGLGVQQLHAQLNNLRFNDGKTLRENDIATIVNYCYYPEPRDPEAIQRIMDRAVFR